MDQNLEQKLDAVMETLTEFKKEFTALQEDFHTHRLEFSRLQNDLNAHHLEFSSLKSELADHPGEFQKKTVERLERIETSILRLETEALEDLTNVRQEFSGRLTSRDYETQALNKRVLQLEGRLESLEQQ
ncbi:hypothetical protein [Salibacterium halotolerans]|uniref:Uncharacterized protein n=1 Tax=Salibacterium halotolerans TaxID=1884432 RepID=A0A1I5XZQ1_9BACI|nr:hypothetical protein [Salibacterium halotolerans]SFQ37396.1 hypothetical protein SAMN05518683_13330 [Salibacterium halotolerans]